METDEHHENIEEKENNTTEEKVEEEITTTMLNTENNVTMDDSMDSEIDTENDGRIDDELTTETATEGSTISETSPKKNSPECIKSNISSKDDRKDGEDNFQCKCVTCGVTKCVMWRKHNESSVLCNLCHLKHVKSTAQPSGSALNTKLINTLVSQNNRAKEQMPRISKRKSKTNKKFANGAYSDRLVKNSNSKNRRNLFKKKPSKAVEGIAAIIHTQSVYNNGLLYEVGDIVCTSDLDGGLYFAQLRGFLQNDYCEKSAIITWLIPTAPNLTQFDPMRFVPGLDEDTPRPMDCFDFVCRAPSNLYKSKLLHPPYERSQVSLENLIIAANDLERDETTDFKHEQEQEVMTTNNT